ncbi:MAG: hypothetical protein WCV50_01840 [Patescibacteria group bacterium]|jgi:hypothetical protein
MSNSVFARILNPEYGVFDEQLGVVPVQVSGDQYQGLTSVYFDWKENHRHYHDNDGEKLISLGMGQPNPPIVHMQIDVHWEEAGSWWKHWKACVSGVPENRIRPVKIVDLDKNHQFPSNHGIWICGCRIYAIFPLTENNLFEVAQLAISSVSDQQIFQFVVQMLLYHASQPASKPASLFTDDDPRIIAEIITLFQGHRKFRVEIGEERLAGLALRVNQAVSAGL